MFQKAKGFGIAAAAVLATVAVPMQTAAAADGCGDGYFKQSDGYLTKTAQWVGMGQHNATVYHQGQVRFCTEDDTFDNDENRRALIGYNSAFESQIFKNAAYTKFCVDQTITAHLSGIPNSDAWDVGGSISKTGPEVHFSFSGGTHTLDLTIDRNQVCGADYPSIDAKTSNISITAANEGGKVDWVGLTTKLTIQYVYKGVKYGDSFPVTEHDNS